MKITLYPPNGEAELYLECEVNGSLMPELEFTGKRFVSLGHRSCGIKPVVITAYDERKRYITTLAYTIEHELEKKNDEQLSGDSDRFGLKRIFGDTGKAPVEGTASGSAGTYRFANSSNGVGS